MAYGVMCMHEKPKSWIFALFVAFVPWETGNFGQSRKKKTNQEEWEWEEKNQSDFLIDGFQTLMFVFMLGTHT